MYKAIHPGLIVKENFSEDDTVLMSYDERRFIVKSRENYKNFQNYSNSLIFL